MEIEKKMFCLHNLYNKEGIICQHFCLIPNWGRVVAAISNSN